MISPLGDIDETLKFAVRGESSGQLVVTRTRQKSVTCVMTHLTCVNAGKLRLQPTVVGVSKWNESVQKLRNGQVAG